MASRLSLPKKANGGKPNKKPKKAKAKGEWQTEKARWLPKKAMANGNSKSVTALERMVWTLKDNVEFLTDRVAALERWPYWDDEEEGAEAVDRTDAA